MKITFDKEKHKYTFDNKPLLNFSTFKKKYLNEFDSFSASSRSAKSSGGNAMHIMKGWNKKSSIHRNYGTVMHDTMEGYIKYNIIPDDLYLSYFLERWQKEIDKLGLDKADITAELLTGNKELLIGGLIDLSHEKYNLDLKTGNFKRKKKGNFKKPFNFIQNSPLGSATFQLNFYRLFEKQDDKNLIVMYWNGREFEIIEIEKFDEEKMALLTNEIKNYGNIE